MATNPVRAMQATQDEIDAANRQLLAMGFLPISGGEQTPEEIAAEAEAKRLADEEAAKAIEEEKHLNDAGKEALRKEREARKAAKKEADDAKAELTTLRAEKLAADAAKAKADEEEATKRGEFQTLAEQRAEALKAKDAELAARDAKINDLIVSIKPEVDSAWKDLPSEVSELYSGAEDDVLAKRAFMSTHRKLIDALAGKAEERKNGFRTPKVPTPNGKGGDTDLEKQAREANARRYQ